MFSKVKRNHNLWFLVCSDPPCQQSAYTCISELGMTRSAVVAASPTVPRVLKPRKDARAQQERKVSLARAGLSASRMSADRVKGGAPEPSEAPSGRCPGINTVNMT